MKHVHQPYSISGKLHSDSRGTLSFVNDFTFDKVQRFYQVTQNFSEPVRAFHAHQHEAKYVYVTQGRVLLILVSLDSFPLPKKKGKIYRFFLDAREPSILYIPPGFANGFKVLEPNTQVIFFSDKSLAESQADDYRFAYDHWGTEIWNEV